ncbi:bifunctional Armadillo-type fold/Armadillo-like helical/Pumilio-like protein 3 [Babesia duncani]|uniref:Bifunctional Armadillo-type fold/Armadillo-like helical/Pumilio-like protein 3 n=1 Tax=Babesia duncani TaxID=323732 RepID=A0AAD9PII9_9APIC|nr:bifunctional Armadillo-type fold/Armadillo-like helical/Pumilio-like protein 3 [Babesia duncani]
MKFKAKSKRPIPNKQLKAKGKKGDKIGNKKVAKNSNVTIKRTSIHAKSKKIVKSSKVGSLKPSIKSKFQKKLPQKSLQKSPREKTRKNVTKLNKFANSKNVAKSKVVAKNEKTRDQANISKKVTKSKVIKTLKDYKEGIKPLMRTYSKLLLNHRDATSCKETVKELLEYAKPPLEITKRSISKILQACLKYGDANDRLEIFNRFKENANLTNLNACSAAFISKLYKYGEGNVKVYLKDLVFKNKSLLFTRYGSYIMDSIYSTKKTREQMEILQHYTVSNQLLLDCDASRLATNSLNQLVNLLRLEEYKTTCLEKCQGTIDKLVNKQLLSTSIAHDLIQVYIRIGANKEQLMNSIYKYFGQMLSTSSGNDALCCLISHANAKIKKKIIMRLKTHFPEAAYNATNVSLLVRLVACTDDIVWLGKHLISPLLQNLDRVIYHVNAHKVLLACLDPPKVTDAPFTIKDEKKRREQLANILEPLLEWLLQCNLIKVMEHDIASKVLKGAILCFKREDLIMKIINAEGIYSHGPALKIAQLLVKPKRATSAALVHLKPWVPLWNKILKDNLKLVYTTRLVFLLLDVLEAAVEHDSAFATRIKLALDKAEISEAISNATEGHATGLEILARALE